jgi:hypothetical protein
VNTPKKSNFNVTTQKATDVVHQNLHTVMWTQNSAYHYENTYQTRIYFCQQRWCILLHSPQAN